MKEVNFVHKKLILLIALTLLIVLALQGIAELPFRDSWWDGG
jgi:hypothetical protein